MPPYELIECVCGQKARIVVCGVGRYISCPWCNRSTYMTNDRKIAERKWKELMDSYRKEGKTGDENVR